MSLQVPYVAQQEQLRMIVVNDMGTLSFLQVTEGGTRTHYAHDRCEWVQS
jgi:hypothetical protein